MSFGAQLGLGTPTTPTTTPLADKLHAGRVKQRLPAGQPGPDERVVVFSPLGPVRRAGQRGRPRLLEWAPLPARISWNYRPAAGRPSTVDVLFVWRRNKFFYLNLAVLFVQTTRRTMSLATTGLSGTPEMQCGSSSSPVGHLMSLTFGPNYQAEEFLFPSKCQACRGHERRLAGLPGRPSGSKMRPTSKSHPFDRSMQAQTHSIKGASRKKKTTVSSSRLTLVSCAKSGQASRTNLI